MNLSNRFFIGIDPEPTGAIAIIEYSDTGKESITIADTPIDNNVKERWILLDKIIPKYKLHGIAVIEKMQSRPRQNIKAMDKLLYSAGIWEGLLYTSCQFLQNIYLIYPVTWKAYYGLSSDKTESFYLAKKLYPIASDFLRVSSTVSDKNVYNRSEALLLADYAKRTYLGETEANEETSEEEES